MFTQVLFWARNQSNHQNFDPSLLAKKLSLSKKNQHAKFKPSKVIQHLLKLATSTKHKSNMLRTENAARFFIITDQEKVAHKRIQIMFTDNAIYH